jgi:colanic acid/amylovoran biosynthesis glycosyltransferase
MKVFFLIRNFPILSQTFVIDNILSIALEKVPFEILTFKKNEVQKNVADYPKFKNYIKQNDIKEIKDQSSGIVRIVESIFYLLNPKKLYFFLKICELRKKLTFSHIYQMKSFSRIEKDSVLHVHFANSIYYIKDFLKVGFISPKVIVSIHGKDIIWLGKFVKQENNIEFLESIVGKFLCNSHYTREKLLGYGFSRKKSKVHYLGIDTTFFSSFKTKKAIINELNLISVGRLIQLKGHYYSILAVEQLVLSGLNVNYKIIGEGPEFLSLDKMIKEKKLENFVELCGKMDKVGIKNELNNSDLFLFPSTFCDKTKRREAFGIASLEA